jgi:hypothetical protein
MDQTSSPKPVAAWLMLISRCVLFLFFQAVIALVLLLLGHANAWDESAGWWLYTVIPTNLVCVYLLVILFKAEGKRYLDLLRFTRATVGRDLLWLLGSSVIGVPAMALPLTNLAVLIFGNAMEPVNMMFKPLPVWALALGLLFPLTIAFAELPTYYGYVMPRLALQVKNTWVALLIAAFFLALQHSFMPFIPDGRFFLWRFGMFLPFALFAGLVLKLRPGLMPYMVILHGLLDVATLSTYMMV